MAALKRQVTDRNMRFDESEIRRKMDEIADWLNDQSAPPVDRARSETIRTSPARTEPSDLSPSLESIAANRLAARRQREAEDRAGLRSVLERFPGPIARPHVSPRGPLSSAVAEIMERQRELNENGRDGHPAVRACAARRDEDARRAQTDNDGMGERSVGMEARFESFVARFEARAEQTFQSLESSLGEVRRLLDEAKTPVEAAEAAAAYIVQTRIHDLETGTNAKIEEVARGLAELRAETAESERRTRDLLDAVRATLEHVANRLPERHGHRPAPIMPLGAPPASAPASASSAATPAEAEPSITLRVREAARRAMEDSAEEEPLNPGPRIGGATPERRRFIAAARRSVTEGEREPAPKYRAASPRKPRANAFPETPAKARPRHGAVKRILLGGMAAAVLVLGIYAGSSRLLDSLLTSQEVAMVEPEPSADTAPAEAQARPPASAASAPSSSLFSTEPVSGASSFSANEPVVTGSIAPPSPPATPLPALPPEIGGEHLRSRAQAGDAAAQYEVAMRLAEGQGVPRDHALAAQWFRRAADQGLAPAQYRLASIMEKGMGMAKDLPGARDLYEKAAAAGNVQSMHNLGVMYAEGGLGETDLATAFAWFQKAADHGVKDSQYNLGIFYARGLATAQDFGQSYFWFALAAAQGDKDAAAKRDQIAAKLDADKLTALRVTVDTWKPKAVKPEANTVAIPAEG